MRVPFLLMLLPFCLLAGCSDNDELHDYVTQVKSRPPMPIEPLPVIKNFKAMEFAPETDRIPFGDPQPEVAQAAQDTKANCLQPDLKRKKEPLEQYSLDNLKMSGTMGGEGRLWALIHSQEGEVYRVGLGQYMGLNQGKVNKITPDSVELQEIVPDGKGCWTNRITKLNLLVVQ